MNTANLYKNIRFTVFAPLICALSFLFRGGMCLEGAIKGYTNPNRKISCCGISLGMQYGSMSGQDFILL